MAKDPQEVRDGRWFRSKGGSYAQAVFYRGEWRLRYRHTMELSKTVWAREEIAEYVSRWLKHKPPKARARKSL